jgi:hypothetical protein
MLANSSPACRAARSVYEPAPGEAPVSGAQSTLLRPRQGGAMSDNVSELADAPAFARLTAARAATIVEGAGIAAQASPHPGFAPFARSAAVSNGIAENTTESQNAERMRNIMTSLPDPIGRIVTLDESQKDPVDNSPQIQAPEVTLRQPCRGPLSIC